MTRRSHIVVPCFNEASRLRPDVILDFLRRPGRNCRIWMVNDGCTDETPTILNEMQQTDLEHIRILHLPSNVGKAEAVRRGILLAAADNPDCLGYWDADLATPLDAIAELEELLEEQEDVDIVLGARVKLMGRQIARNPLRHYLGRVFATAASCTLGLPVYDTQCGAKLFRATPKMLRLFERPFLTDWIFDVEILARMIQADRHPRDPSDVPVIPVSERIYEYPLREWQDVSGSKVTASAAARAFYDLARIYSAYLR